MVGLFDKFKKKEKAKPKKESKKEIKKKEAVKAETKREVKKEVKKEEKPREVVKAKVKPQSLAYRILVKPLISEKASTLNEAGKYIFIVAKRAKKQEVKQAICDIYGVKTEKINFINVHGKERRYGRTLGKTSDFKKAVITLPEGKAIQVHEGV